MATQQLIDRTVDYLRQIGVLEGKPVFEKATMEFVSVDPRGQWDEYFMLYPYWQNRPVEFHESRFRQIQTELSSIGKETAQERMLSMVPDSKDAVLIELGSEYGVFGAGYIATQKPNIEVRLVSKPWDESRPAQWLFNDISGTGLKYQVRFTRGHELAGEKDLERRVSGLYQQNGISNVRFYEHVVSEADLNGTIPPFLKGLSGKQIFLLGHLSPAQLPFLMGMLYNKMNAKAMLVSLTALEKIRPSDFPWEIVQRNLGLTDAERDGYIKSAHDPIAADTKGSMSGRYDYDNPAQKRVGVMIKLGMALALAKEVDGEVLRTVCRFHIHNYNKEDHYVSAKRG